jgi:hypothetical protein
MFNDSEWYEGSVSFRDSTLTAVSALVRVDLSGGVAYTTSTGMTLLAPWDLVQEVQINLSPRLKTVDNQDRTAAA